MSRSKRLFGVANAASLFWGHLDGGHSPKPQLVQPLVFLLLLPDVLSNHSLILAHRGHEVPSRPARRLYEELYCARGEMENRIKEQISLFADRTSTAFLRSNQVRLYFSSVAYLLMEALHRLGLEGTELAQAQCDTLRLKLLKIGAQIRVTIRRIWVSLAEGYAYAAVFAQVHARLRALPMPAG